MFCNHCGKQNPDSSAFCSSCGKPLTATATPQPSPRQASAASCAADTAPAYTVDTFYKRFRIAWRGFATRPFSLVLLICYSLSVLINIYQFNALLGDASSVLYFVDFLPSIAIYAGSSLTLLTAILSCVPGILNAVGMWLIYADALDHSDRPISSKGLTLIYVTSVFNAILFGIGILLSFIGIITFSQYGTSTFEATLWTFALFGLIVAAIAGFCIMPTYIRLANSIREAAANCTCSTDYVKTIAILQFVGGGAGAIGLFVLKITLTSLLTVALPILFGIMLLGYKRFMDNLYAEKEYIIEQSRPQTENPWEKLYK